MKIDILDRVYPTINFSDEIIYIFLILFKVHILKFYLNSYIKIKFIK